MKLRIPALILFLLGLSLSAFAQDDRLTVIARSGLNLRSGPGVSNAKVVTVPFGKSVRPLQPFNSDLTEDPDTVRVGGVLGKWILVNYEGKSGYAFTGYLCEMVQLQPAPREAWYLLYAGADCNVPFLNLPALPYQYAIFDRGNGKMEVRPAKLSYHSLNVGLGSWLELEDDQEGDALYYLITKKPAPTGMISAINTSMQDSMTAYYSGRGTFTCKEYNLSLTVTPDQVDTNCAKTVTLQIGNKKQVLYVGKPQNQDEGCWDSFWMDWVGDLDGDGKPDLVWARGRYYAAEVELWLSSLAKPGDLVGKAMKRFESGCC